MDLNKINYSASNTGREFHNDDSKVRGIIGPIGSGKSVASIMEILFRALKQEPDKNGKRRSRTAVVRNTRPELQSTTIQTFQEWIPQSMCPIVVRNGVQVGNIFERLPDGTFLDAEIMFIPLDKPSDSGRLLSLELTFLFINEARELPWALIRDARTRLGRYPPQSSRPNHIEKKDWPTWYGAWFDTNPPDTDSWWYEKFVEKNVKGWTVFHQPPAMLPVYNDGKIERWELNKDGDAERGIKAAENLRFLTDNYYQDLANGNDDEWLKIMVEGNYGVLSNGRPVFPRFTTSEHVNKEPLEIYEGVPLILGSDNGLHGVTLLCQIDPINGKLRVLRELIRHGESLGEFINEAVKGALLTEFRGCSVSVNHADPACNNRQSISGNSEIDIWNYEGIHTLPATTQAPQARINAVGSRLEKKGAGILIDPSCKQLIKGMSGEYKFRRVQTGGITEMYTEKPLKNKFADSCDALQYICVSMDERFSPTEVVTGNTEFNLVTNDSDLLW